MPDIEFKLIVSNHGSETLSVLAYSIKKGYEGVDKCFPNCAGHQGNGVLRFRENGNLLRVIIVVMLYMKLQILLSMK